jgi:methyltransferase
MGLAVFVVAKALKYWAIATLGTRWTFRVLVVPGAPLVGAGPYRFMRHPNYVGVCLELVGMACMARAFVSGPLAVGVFAALLVARMRVEDRALGRR